MKRILVAMSASEINIKMLDFACFIANLTHSRLIGVFLNNKDVQEEIPSDSLHGVPESKPKKINKQTTLFEENTRLFSNACSNRGANWSIYNDINIPVAEIIKESRFAELLIVDADMSFKEKKEEIPSRFIKEVLAKSECPVVLAPFDFYGIDEILFAYDGKPASVYAIKQFTYLFPQLTNKKLTILHVNENDNDSFVEKNKIGELLQMHYSSIGFQLLHGMASDELFGYLLGKKNLFVVMGAFGRGMLSGLVKHSTAELIIKTINLPVFIAHHK